MQVASGTSALWREIPVDIQDHVRRVRDIDVDRAVRPRRYDRGVGHHRAVEGVQRSYAFYPVQPCRVADTCAAAGPFGGPAMTGAQSRDFQVPSSSCGLPPTASAYSMNVTVVPGGYLGYLKTWPTGQAQPNVSTLNSWTGKVVANAAIVPAGNGGSISAYTEDLTEVVLDTTSGHQARRGR